MTLSLLYLYVSVSGRLAVFTLPLPPPTHLPIVWGGGRVGQVFGLYLISLGYSIQYTVDLSISCGWKGVCVWLTADKPPSPYIQSSKHGICSVKTEFLTLYFPSYLYERYTNVCTNHYSIKCPLLFCILRNTKKVPFWRRSL